MIILPEINPVALHIGFINIRWYSLAYVAGIIIGWLLVKHFNKKEPVIIKDKKALDDIVVWAVLGVVLGGRLGYMLFYNLPYYLHNPLQILQVWQGGMSFHGGLIGFALSMLWFCRKYKISYLGLMDLMAIVAPIGLFFGRIANFINLELWGRITNMPWAMVFPTGGPFPRHPSQLYEAILEGLLLFIILFSLAKLTKIRDKTGMLTGLFMIGYSLSRMFAEYFREPDAQIGFLFGGVTMGQLLSLGMMIAGFIVLVYSKKYTNPSSR